jgi:hypothetical protein
MVFGSIFAYLGINHYSLLISSPFLLFVALGAAFCYLLLARRYWFSIPFRGILAALLCLILSVLIAYT